MEDICVDVTGYLKRYMPELAMCRAEEWEGKVVGELLSSLPIPGNVNYAIMVNGVRRDPKMILEAGDQIKVVPILGGG